MLFQPVELREIIEGKTKNVGSWECYVTIELNNIKDF
jgi:hypothetical protein